MGFDSLQHIKDRRSTRRGFCLPATFRPQGLITLSAVYSLRTPAGFISHQRRSWDSPFGAFPSRKVFRPSRSESTHILFLSAFCPPQQQTPLHRAGLRNRSSWVLTLPRVPCDSGTRLTHRTPDTPLGFPLLGSSGESLAWDFSQSSSHALGSHKP